MSLVPRHVATSSVVLTVGLGMSAFVPANRFSLHGMYKARLVRTFVGASRPDRRPNAFTGFDSGDDLRVHDLANATRRIRLDLGIPVQFSPLAASRAGQGHGNPHGAIGIVRYGVVDGPDAPDGVILYLKATLSGDEPVDVWNFAATHPAFPHDPTTDQFFDEARFESYRTLGFHTVLTVTAGYDGAGGIEGLCDHVRRTMMNAQPPRPEGRSEGAQPETAG